MQLTGLSRILGIWILLFSTSLIPPLIVSVIYNDGELSYFTGLLAAYLIVGWGLWASGTQHNFHLKIKDGFKVVVALWFVTSVLAAIPFIICLKMSPADAFFEAVSALTTTGATVITGLDYMPRAILFFRQELQWLGGIGVAVSAIALVPMLGIGGMQIFNAETPGPAKDEKLAPRIKHTASILWRIYLGMTLVCAAAYWSAGMSVYDALAHSFSTVSTGGFSTHDASLGYFESVSIETIAIVFMMLGGINFSVHFAAWRGLSVERYWENDEVRAFVLVTAFLALLVAVLLYVQGDASSVFEASRLGAFTVVSVITSTGFGITNFSVWTGALPIFMIFIGFVGGCGGSTAGGIKVMRFMIMFSSIKLEILRLIHPPIARPMKVLNKPVGKTVVEGVRAFMILYVITFIFFTLVMVGMGMDFKTAFSAVATCINNLGPGLGEFASNFQTVTAGEKWMLSLVMLMGRLEVFTLLVLLTPMYWKN